MAWKVDVHIWVAAQVLKDVQSGDNITLNLDGRIVSISLPPERARAIRNHPRAFLLGSIGPDAFPDVWGGQIVIHPSFPGGWGTRDWLRHLMNSPAMSEEELAFVLGYFTHAAADTFAHTFVNRYAGDIFDITNHPTAAIRHIAIESLVSNYLPPVDVPGRDGSLSDLVRSDGRIEFPEDLILDRLLFNAEALDQLKRGGAPHFAAAHSLYRDLDRLLDDDGLLAKVENLAADIALEYLAGVPIDDEISQQLAQLGRDVNRKLAEVGQELTDEALWLNDRLSELEGLPIDISESAMEVAFDLAEEVDRLILDVAELEAEILLEANRLRNWPTETIEDEICSAVTDLLGDIAGKICKTVNVTRYIREAEREILEVFLRERNRLLGQTTRELERVRERAKSAIRDGFEVVRAAHEVRRRARATIIAFALEQPGDPLRGHFTRWRDGIPIALIEYTRANAAAIVNSVDPAKPSITDPLKDWLICYGPAFVSVPVRATEGACFVYDGFTELQERIDEFEESLAELVPGADELLKIHRELTGLIDDLQQELFNVAIEEGLKEFQRHTNAPVLDLYKALTAIQTEQSVSNYFSADSSGQGLPIIPDAGTRLIEEMKIVDGVLDANQFAPLYNSVVLSQLAMLDARGLRQLARAAGVRETIYGRDLYGGSDFQSENVLYGFLRSIDGNHQWHELSPPHPRVNVAAGFDEADFRQRFAQPEDFGYGYRDANCGRPAEGMRMWVDPSARVLLFKALFIGPIAEGIDAPERLGTGFPDALPDSYPLRLREGESLLSDGIDEIPGRVSLRFIGVGEPDGAFAIFTQSTRLYSGQYDQDGQANVIVSIDRRDLPAHIDIVELGGRLSVRAHFSVGCSGQAIALGSVGNPKIRVERGDSLWRIAERIVGEGERYPEIYDDNRESIRDPDLIYPDQILRSPWSSPMTLRVEEILAP